MGKLEEDKLKEEIRNLKISSYVDLLKGVALLIGAIVLFFAVQMPESILNRKLSKESVSRDRAKLVFELIHNNKDNENILLELSVIEKAYPDEDKVWITEIKNIYRTRTEKSNNKNLVNIQNYESEKVRTLRNELNYLLVRKEKLQIDYVSEISGKGASGKLGIGIVAQQLKNKIMNLDNIILEKQNEINNLMQKEK